jgi:hypothetical protein
VVQLSLEKGKEFQEISGVVIQQKLFLKYKKEAEQL